MSKFSYNLQYQKAFTEMYRKSMSQGVEKCISRELWSLALSLLEAVKDSPRSEVVALHSSRFEKLLEQREAYLNRGGFGESEDWDRYLQRPITESEDD